jgi:hypothetical protein
MYGMFFLVRLRLSRYGCERSNQFTATEMASEDFDHVEKLYLSSLDIHSNNTYSSKRNDEQRSPQKQR